MKKIFLWIVLMFAMLLTACQAAPAAPTAAPATEVPTAVPPTQPPAEPALTLNGAQTRSLTLDEIRQLPAVTGQAGIKSSTGKITPPAEFKGVLLTELVKQIGGADSSMAIQLEARDGYAMTFSYDQVAKGEFITYDPGTGDETHKGGTLQAILAYEMDGKPLNPDNDGQLRLVVVSEKPNQVVDGHWSVKFVTKLALKPLAAEWNLVLQGAINDKIDRGSFESCSTGKCHPATFQDDKAQTWSGTPLYLLVGRVDDESKHDTGAYNRVLADLGYTVEIVAKDGYTVTFDSARLKGNANIIVANAVNGNPLNDQDFPLRLVGSEVGKKEGVGAIEKIIVHANETQGSAAQPTPVPTAAPTAAPDTQAAGPTGKSGSLVLAGLVEKVQTWSLDDLKKLEVVKLTVEHPKKGKMDVEGVRLSSLFALGQLQSKANGLVFSAADGFSAESELKAILECQDCMVSFNTNGSLSLAMPGLSSSLWVKDIVKIEVK